MCPVDEVKWIRLNLDRLTALSAELLADIEALASAPIERLLFGQIFLKRVCIDKHVFVCEHECACLVRVFL